MRALALFPLSAIVAFPPSLLAVYEVGQQSSTTPVKGSQRLEAAAKTDSSAILKQAWAIAKPKSLT
ncbi:MAG: hypothetical protein LH679_15560, partial [Cyanobacteria bacterium CAN_BIN43]|nr:hypothetical protein [Cyanobacteria bacterium CAN_BIN43]